MRSDLLDIAGVIHHETAKAILFSDTDDKEGAVWLPKSAIEYEPAAQRGYHMVTIPERLALDKGLI